MVIRHIWRNTQKILLWQNPIVKVGDYEISVNDVDPENATEIEMFALMSHLDKTGQSRNEFFFKDANIFTAGRTQWFLQWYC